MVPTLLLGSVRWLCELTGHDDCTICDSRAIISEKSTLHLLKYNIYYFLATLCGIWDLHSPTQGSNLPWECRVLTTRPPGKCLLILFRNIFFPDAQGIVTQLICRQTVLYHANKDILYFFQISILCDSPNSLARYMSEKRPVQATCTQIPTWLLISCVILASLVHFSKPEFLHLRTEVYLPRCFTVNSIIRYLCA